MKYPDEIMREATSIISKRRISAEKKSQENHDMLAMRFPKLLEIESALSECGAAVVKAFFSENYKEIVKAISEKSKSLQTERDKIIINAGLAKNALEPDYFCKICNDRGFFENGTPCECRLTLLNELYNKNNSLGIINNGISFENFSLEYYSDKAVVGKNSIRDIMKSRFDFAKKYADKFSIDSGNLYFFGKTGLGKTHLAMSIANQVTKKGYSVYFGSVGNILKLLEAERFGKETDADLGAIVYESDLLIIDDFGTEFETKFSKSELFNIINTRLNKTKPTIICSNLNADELKDKYDELLASRIIGSYYMLLFVGDDIRQQKRR
ncbi:MAG: ATP-binding protein [Candidatus Fimenecus sp.]